MRAYVIRCVCLWGTLIGGCLPVGPLRTGASGSNVALGTDAVVPTSSTQHDALVNLKILSTEFAGFGTMRVAVWGPRSVRPPLARQS